MIVQPIVLLVALAIAATAALLSLAMHGLFRYPVLRASLLGGTCGVCATYAGAVVPLSFGLAITQSAVQAAVGACLVAGLIVGWFAPTRWFPLVVLVAGVLSFVVISWAVAVLYPPAQHG